MARSVQRGVTRGWRPVMSDPDTKVVLAYLPWSGGKILRILGGSGASEPVPMAGCPACEVVKGLPEQHVMTQNGSQRTRRALHVIAVCAHERAEV